MNSEKINSIMLHYVSWGDELEDRRDEYDSDELDDASDGDKKDGPEEVCVGKKRTMRMGMKGVLDGIQAHDVGNIQRYRLDTHVLHSKSVSC